MYNVDVWHKTLVRYLQYKPTTPKLEHFEMHINNSLGASVIEMFDNDSDLRP
jgi:hypothetical protein